MAGAETQQVWMSAASLNGDVESSNDENVRFGVNPDSGSGEEAIVENIDLLTFPVPKLEVLE